MSLIKIYVDLPYIVSRDMTRKIRTAIEEYIYDDDLGVFSNIRNYMVNFIEGKDATKLSEHLNPVINLVFDSVDDVTIITERVNDEINKIIKKRLAMGNRISIQFENNGIKSAILFSHNLGLKLVLSAHFYIEELRTDTTGSLLMPLDRFESVYMMFDFVNKYLDAEDCYLTADLESGDNSDNGHYIIHVDKDTLTTYTKETQNEITKKYYIDEIGILKLLANKIKYED